MKILQLYNNVLRTRIIPCLQLKGESLVKTVKFDKYGYIGDPINTVRIFNELEVDELCFLDIRATREKTTPNLDILKHIADECFMPLSYGGGIANAEKAKQILAIGFEKIVINTAAYDHPTLITEIAHHSGAQSVVASIDVKKNFLGRYQVYTHSGTQKRDIDPLTWARKLEEYGAGEILLTSIDREGLWRGYDVALIEQIAKNVSIPVIANGGAGELKHLQEAIRAGASALALGSMVVYQQKGMGVLINMPFKSV